MASTRRKILVFNSNATNPLHQSFFLTVLSDININKWVRWLFFLLLISFNTIYSVYIYIYNIYIHTYMFLYICATFWKVIASYHALFFSLKKPTRQLSAYSSRFSVTVSMVCVIFLQPLAILCALLRSLWTWTRRGLTATGKDTSVVIT